MRAVMLALCLLSFSTVSMAATKHHHHNVHHIHHIHHHHHTKHHKHKHHRHHKRHHGAIVMMQPGNVVIGAKINRHVMIMVGL
ncbi:MAG: hypothetical protein AB7V32_03315 [Candidatus Berkiella sp.]